MTLPQHLDDDGDVLLDNWPLLFVQGIHHGLIQIQVRLHQFRWGQGHPLVQRDVREVGAFAQFQEAQQRAVSPE
jgi:hypothetical protein